MKYREFGNSGIRVSEIGFGAWPIGGNAHGNSYGTTDDRQSLEAIERAIALGCNFFDTADVYGYGHSEELLGRAIRHGRDRVVIATKVGGDFYTGAGRRNFGADYIRFALDKSLKRLRTDYLDVYQLHNPPLKLIEKEETYAVLKDLKREGKIRAWGLSIFDPIEGLTALRIGRPDCIQVVYNIFSPRAAEELLPKAGQAGCAIIAREPLANGFLTGKYAEDSHFEPGDIRHDWPRPYISARVRASARLRALAPDGSLARLALRFAISSPHVSVVIPGTKTAEQAQDNMQASDDGPLANALLSQLKDLAARNFEL